MLTNTPRKPSFQTILTYTLTLIIVILLVFILRSFIVPSNEFFQSATIYRKPPESFRLKLKIFNHQLLSSNAYDGANKLPDPWLSRGRIVSSGTSHSNLENYEFGVAKSLSKRKRRINKLSSQLGNTFAKIQHDAKRFEVQTTTNLRKVAKLKDLPEKISYVPLPKDQEIGWEWVPDVESTAIPDTLKKSISLPSENHKKLIYDTIEFIEKLPLDQLKQIQNMAADLHQKNQPIISQNPPVQNIPPSNDWPVDMLTIIPSTPPHKRESAAILVLCQNKDLESLLQSLRMFEDRFNRRFRYPYVILNDQPFNDVFKTRVTALVSSPVEFGGLVPGTWEYPTHINKTVADLCRERMARDGVMYGGSESYRHMCRWYSGWFFRHPLLEKFEWYWRLEPGVSFYCDVTYDPFVFLRLQNKVYGFNIALLEIRDTIPSLWALTRYFAIEQGIDNSTLLAFLADETGDYNGCHFWSNFEIARLDVWRSPGYLKYFEYLDKWGGFYYERWGDAPIHSLYLALSYNKSQIHFFNDIGYKHDNFLHCSTANELKYTCQCPEDESFDWNVGSCLQRWLTYPDEGLAWTFDEDIRPLKKVLTPDWTEEDDIIWEELIEEEEKFSMKEKVVEYSDDLNLWLGNSNRDEMLL